ncbi:hypothetical protein [Bacillus sp. 1P06AnD]|uniref:hypothetical protein n=1 Tax=Bacillus sp. 1P06AnD TaxID=3132208 RepID=UPI0039A25C88
MRERLILCLLLIICMLYYAVPQMKSYSSPEQLWFAGAWLMLALFAAAGNMAALLYKGKYKKQAKPVKTSKKRKRSYNY